MIEGHHKVRADAAREQWLENRLRGNDGKAIAHTGAAELNGTRLLVRELEPEKQKLEPAELSARELEAVAEQSAAVLAHAHHDRKALLRWVGDDRDRLAVELGRFALEYAEQVRADHRALRSR